MYSISEKDVLSMVRRALTRAGAIQRAFLAESATKGVISLDAHMNRLDVAAHELAKELLASRTEAS